VSRNAGKSRHRRAAAQPVAARSKVRAVALGVALSVGVGSVGYWVVSSPGDGQASPPAISPPESPTPKRSAQDLEQLLTMTPKQLASVDVAEMNLLCATGLPGAKDLDIDTCLAKLDAWAARVKSETDRHLYRFQQKPGEYEHSEGYFRMLMLVTVLQQDFGVHYNLERVRKIDFRQSQDLFIHGLISDNGGTCVSMPALYVAVARRLGYPLKLVLAKAHVFCRWDTPGDRVNIEGSGRGMNTYPDKYYKTWPLKLSPEEIASGRFLRSLTPSEELGSFLASRGHCLSANGQLAKAQQAYTAAARLAPREPSYLAWADQAGRRLMQATVAAHFHRNRPGGPVTGYSSLSMELQRIDAVNAQSRRAMEKAMQPPTQAPPPDQGQWNSSPKGEGR